LNVKEVAAAGIVSVSVPGVVPPIVSNNTNPVPVSPLMLPAIVNVPPPVPVVEVCLMPLHADIIIAAAPRIANTVFLLGIMIILL
jgi:hypothetical protein